MKITVTEEVANWYRDELDVNDGDNIRFFVRYGGFSTVQEGFSLGISVEAPENEVAFTDVLNIHFYVEENDSWYFEDGLFEVVLDDKTKSPAFNVVK